MEKKLSKSDYIFSLLFIFVLIAAIGAFFFGMQTGQKNAEAKYENILKQRQELPEDLTAYNQQLLVSFYHTIFRPSREFQLKWFEHINTMSANNESVDPASLFKQLANLSSEQYQAVLPMTMPASSPLLQDSQQNYLKSLKLFSEASRTFQSTADRLKGGKLIEAIDNDAFFQNAKSFDLQAQQQYYEAIARWHASIDPKIKSVELQSNAALSIQDWKSLHLNVKNAYVAEWLAAEKVFAPFYVQDATSRIDDLIASGQTVKLNLTDVNATLGMLVNTGAIRQGDFIKNKMKLYANERLPQLPFFSSNE